ncbi:MAG: hypothetical protein A2V89_01595 [Gammaproteobacteria bacterium RBG_16_37_9]|nr:MAG: hypothetical protein A2V89_01595 [Gammaproteobacteria bacterium RBG_16_37_9]
MFPVAGAMLIVLVCPESFCRTIVAAVVRRVSGEVSVYGIPLPSKMIVLVKFVIVPKEMPEINVALLLPFGNG